MRTRFVINEEEVFTENPLDLLVLALNRTDLKYWSYDALKEFLFETLDHLHEFCVARRKELDKNHEVFRKQLIAFPRRIKGIKQWFPQTQEAAVNYIYNQILNCEGVGLLPGFGMTDYFKEAQYGNPEIKSIYK